MNELIKVKFRGQEIETVFDGETAWVSVRKVCNNLDINFSSQRKKLQSHPTFRKGVAIITTPSKGGPQEMYCIELRFFPLWLANIHPDKIKKEQKEVLIHYQVEAAEVLAEHIFGTPEEKSSQSSPVPASPAQQLLAQAQILVDQEQRLAMLEEKVEQQEQRREDAQLKLLEMPEPLSLPLPRTRRSILVEYMRAVAIREELSHQDLWLKLYVEFKHRNRVDIRSRAKKRKVKNLDVAENDGFIEPLYDLACWLWPQ